MSVRLPVAIIGTGVALPGRAVDTRTLIATALPHRDVDELAARVGIAQRYWVGPGETVASLGATALRGALEAAGISPGALRRLILVTSTGGDCLIPATANLVAEALGIDDSCDAFDLNNSCAGFMSGLDLAARSVATGLGPVAVVASEVYSRYISPARPRPYLVLGDAAAAVVLGESEAGGVLGTHLRNSSSLRGRMTTSHPGITGTPAVIDFTPSSSELTESAFSAMQKSGTLALAEAGLPLGEIEWLLPHQPNGEMLGLLGERLGLDPARLCPIVRDIGSVGAASVPYSLDRLLRTGRVRSGDRLLLLGVGSGTGYGALVYQHGAAAPPREVER